MPIVDTLFQAILIQPIYNLLLFIYVQVGNHAGLTLIVVGMITAAVFMPSVITSYNDQLRTKSIRKQIQQIQLEVQDPQEQQDRIFKLLQKKNIAFKSESIFLFGLGLVALVLYPVLLNHWMDFEPSLIYSWWAGPESFSPMWGSVNLSQSNPAISLIPAILLFFELRMSYREQDFLTSFIDRWYPVLLPLFVYFLIFWLPASISIVMASALLVSIYLRLLMYIFAGVRHRQKPSA